VILLASNEPSISRLNSNIVHNGDYINLRRDELYKNGTYLSTRDVIEHVGSIVAVPYEIVDEQVFIYMVKQWRNPVSEWVLEFPAGTLDHNENPNLAVTRNHSNLLL
jgi:ADP-ribose pyrophosphatase